jgi:SulP family sulfate permease
MTHPASAPPPASSSPISTFTAQWRAVVTGKTLPGDVLAGVTVAAVALPLNLALAVACELPPSAGLVAGALGGLVAAVFGGSQLQVTGPAAALSGMVLVIGQKFGATGVATATLMVGVALLAASFLRAGRFAALVPESVLAGFTTGVGLKLLDQQIPELLGFDLTVGEIAQMMHRPHWLHDVSWLAVVSGLFVAFVVVTTRPWKRFPGAIVAIGLVSFASTYLSWNVARVGDVPAHFPSLSLPSVADEAWLDLLMLTLPLAILAGVESLLSARAVNRMATPEPPYHPDLELFGQGLANVAVGLFSGMPVTGVVVRSSVNVQNGGRTRVSAIVHALLLGVAVVSLSTVIAQVPLAALAGLLCVVGTRLLEVHVLRELLHHNKLEALAFVVAAAGTVSGWLMTGLIVGMIIHLAAEKLAATSVRTRQATSTLVDHAASKQAGVRAVLHREHGVARKQAPQELPSSSVWLGNIRARPQFAASAYVHPQATVIGNVVVGEHAHIAAESSVRADEGTPFFIGPNTNLQDGVVLHALKERHVVVAGERWAIYLGKNVSVAHDALVHGPCYVGDDTFIGFKAVVHDAIVGRHCFVGIGAIVVGVEVPDGRFVPPGSVIDTQDKVDALPPVSEAHGHFNEDVVDVNRGLAVAYQRHDTHGASSNTRAAGPVVLRTRERPPRAWDPAWERVSSSTHSDRF